MIPKVYFILYKSLKIKPNEVWKFWNLKKFWKLKIKSRLFSLETKEFILLYKLYTPIRCQNWAAHLPEISNDLKTTIYVSNSRRCFQDVKRQKFEFVLNSF